MNWSIENFETEDWILVGYIGGLLLWWLLGDLGGSPPAETRTGTRTGYRPTRLQECHLQRLEDGDSVVVPRWHGIDLVLSGDLLVDVEEIEDTEAGDG